MQFRTDFGQLQRLHDAIAITMDAIRRIAIASADGNIRANGSAWIPAPPIENGLPVNRARFEHSAWQPSWPALPPALQHTPAPTAWQEWPRSAQASWFNVPEPGWAAVPWWSPARPF